MKRYTQSGIRYDLERHEDAINELYTSIHEIHDQLSDDVYRIKKNLVAMSFVLAFVAIVGFYL
jgi:hypothetical protein